MSPRARLSPCSKNGRSGFPVRFTRKIARPAGMNIGVKLEALGWRSRTSVTAPAALRPELGHHLLAHHEFLRLAGCGHREFGNEADVPRHLVVGDLSLTEEPYVLRRHR